MERTFLIFLKNYLLFICESIIFVKSYYIHKRHLPNKNVTMKINDAQDIHYLRRCRAAQTHA